MRFREFKPTLLEFAPPAENDEISQLIGILKDPNEDPSLKEKVNNLLLHMLQTVQQQPAQQPVQQKPAQQPVQQQPVQQQPAQEPPVSENMSSSVVQAATANKARLLALLASDPDLQAAHDEIMAEKEQEVRTTVKAERKQGQETIYKLVDSIIKKKFSVAQTESFAGIINVIGDLLRSDEVSYKEMVEFLTVCEQKGVIKTGSMISKEGSEGIIPLTDKKYLPIVSKLLSDTLVSVGNASWGAGEAGLAFCGIAARKEISDISVGKTHVEVKAGSRNIDFFLKGTKGFGTQLQGLETLINTLNEVAAQNGMEPFAMSNQTGKGGIASIGYARLNGTRGLVGLNNYFMRMERKQVQSLLITVLKQIHASKPEIVDQFTSEVKASVGKDSTVDYYKLVQATSKISFAYYADMESHDGLLLLNIPNFTYIYRSAKETESFGELVSDGKIFPSSAIDFRTNSSGGISYKIA